MKSTPTVRQLVDDWVNYSANLTLLSTHGLPKGNTATANHRFDQTLLSLTLKCQYREQGMQPMPKTCNGRVLSSFQV